MELFRNKWLLYPVFFIAGLFVVDKIFLLPEVREAFVQPGGMLYYGQRARQLKALKKYLQAPDRTSNVVIVMGDSRSFALGDMFGKDQGYKDWTIFNFAGPQALPAYHYYLSEKIFKGVDRPRHFLMGISPDAFNRNAGMFATPVLKFGVDSEWIKRNRTHIPDRDYKAYVNSRRFALAGMGFSFKPLFSRISGSIQARFQDDKGIPPEYLPFLFKEDGTPGVPPQFMQLIPMLKSAATDNLSHYSLDHSPQVKILDFGLGAQYAWFGKASDERLKKDTERLVQLYLKSFAPAPEQIYFYRQSLIRARRAGVKTIVFRPRVNPYMLQAIKRVPEISGLWKRLSEIAREEGALAIDLNLVPETACDFYYDASHLSFNCFPPIVKYLLGRLDKMR